VTELGDNNELLGPQELAAAYGVSVALIHQWRKRDKLPPAWRVISGVPLWHWGEIRQDLSDRQIGG
jgi:hypothetical protein